MFSVLLIFPCHQSTVRDSFFSLPMRWPTGSACCLQDLRAPYACAKMSQHLLSASVFSVLLLMFCLPFTAANFWAYVFRELWKKTCLFGVAVLLILYASQDFYSLGSFFPTYFANINTEYLRDPFLCVCGQLLSGVTIWEHWRLMFIKQHSNLQRS